MFRHRRNVLSLSLSLSEKTTELSLFRVIPRGKAARAITPITSWNPATSGYQRNRKRPDGSDLFPLNSRTGPGQPTMTRCLASLFSLSLSLSLSSSHWPGGRIFLRATIISSKSSSGAAPRKTYNVRKWPHETRTARGTPPGPNKKPAAKRIVRQRVSVEWLERIDAKLKCFVLVIVRSLRRPYFWYSRYTT